MSLLSGGKSTFKSSEKEKETVAPAVKNGEEKTLFFARSGRRKKGQKGGPEGKKTRTLKGKKEKRRN